MTSETRKSTLGTAPDPGHLYKDVDEAYDQLGGFGKFQIKTVILCTSILFFGDFSLYPVGFYELQPEYECSIDNQTAWYPCAPQDFCSDDNAPYYRMNKTSERSLENWISYYKIECAPKSQIGLFGTTFFVGIVLGCAILPRMSDIYGRKALTLVGLAIHNLANFSVM